MSVLSGGWAVSCTVDGSKAFDVILPELLEKFPKLKPQILLAAVCEETDTNSPVIPKFLESLKQSEEHPETVPQPTSYFTHLSTTLEDEKAARSHRFYDRGYERTFEHGQYSAVVAMALARQRASEKGLAPPLTDHGKELLADAYRFLGQWQKALDIYTTLTNLPPKVQNECRKHLQLPFVSEAVPGWETDINKVEIAYTNMEHKEWLSAAAILDSIGHRTVVMNRPGPWGWNRLVLPAVVANECRIRAGKPPVKDPMIFELGDIPYIGFSRDAIHFDFQIEGEDVWVGIYKRIERFSGPGPIDAFKPIEMHDFQRMVKSRSTGLCVTPQFIWLGTDGEGLFELDRKTGSARHFTMKDGLLLDGISGLCLQDKTLWIAYRKIDSGGVGTLDLQTHKFSARTPNLNPNAGKHSEPSYNQGPMVRSDQPSQKPVAGMAAGAQGEMWFGVSQTGIQCYHDGEGRWTTFSDFPFNFDCSSIAADTAHDQLLIGSHDSFISENEKSDQGGLSIYNYRENRNDLFQIAQGLPANETTAVAVDGNIAWVGGRGFVAVVDIAKRKVLRIAYLSANNIKKIELGKRYAWVQVYTNPNLAWQQSYTTSEFGFDHHIFDDGGEAQTGIYRLERAPIER